MEFNQSKFGMTLYVGGHAEFLLQQWGMPYVTLFAPVRNDEMKLLGYLELKPTRRIRIIEGKHFVVHVLSNLLPPTATVPENLVRLEGAAMFEEAPL